MLLIVTRDNERLGVRAPSDLARVNPDAATGSCDTICFEEPFTRDLSCRDCPRASRPGSSVFRLDPS